jgi:hypothetical protein
LRLGVGANWRCDDVRLFIDRVNFEQLGPARAGIRFRHDSCCLRSRSIS